VQIYEVGEQDGRPFFSLELVDGGSLDRRVRGTPQAPRPAAGFVAVLARAMHAAHQAGVVHRDLKPANVLLSLKPDAAPATGPEDEGERPLEAFEPKITDFGLAKRLDGEGEHTQSGAVMGTPSYMAPEQAEGRISAIGPRTDVYALAAILYELLTGRPPFKAATRGETIEQVRTQEPVPPSRLQAKLPRDLETICLMGLRKEPEKRYASARELADDLQRWLDGQPILARTVAAWERAVKWARRRPALAALAGVALLAVVGLVTGAVSFALLMGQRATAFRQQLDHNHTADELWNQGLVDEDHGKFDAAETRWVKAQAILDADPDAATPEMRGRLEDRIQRVRRRSEEAAGQQKLLADRQQFAGRRKGFEPHRDQAMFQAVSFGDQDSAAAAVVRREAPAALAAFGLDAGDPKALTAGLDPFRAVIEAPDLARVAEECVEVLLTWARAEATAPAPDGDPHKALRLLEGAAALGEAHGLGTPRALHLHRAHCLELLGNAAEARAERNQAAAVAPATALDHFEAALEDYRAERWEAASTACEEALVRRPGHFWALYVKARCNLRAQRWGEAKVGLDVCLGRHPEYLWLLPLRGVAHGGLKEYPAAESDFARALTASTDPPSQAAALTNRSYLRLMQGRRDDAEGDLRQAIKLQPNVYPGYVTLARIRDERGDRAEAVKLLDRALELSPENSALYYQRARLHAETGDGKAARHDFEQVIAKEPADGKSDRVVAARVELVHLRLQAAAHAAAEQAAAERKAALADCNAVLKVRPDSVDVYRQRAEVLLALKDNKAAAADLDRYLKADHKPTPAAWRARGLLHAERKEHAEAVDAFTRALLLAEKGDADILSNRGWAYLMQGAAQPALADFDTALKLEPKHPDALAGRGTALIMRGRPEDVPAATAAADRSLAPGLRTVSRLMAGARIFARAVGMLEAAQRRPINDADAARYQQRALTLLGEALAKAPEKERPAVWNGVLTDPALLALQRTPGMLQLARTYGR